MLEDNSVASGLTVPSLLALAFVEDAQGQRVMMSFDEPRPCYAVAVESSSQAPGVVPELFISSWVASTDNEPESLSAAQHWHWEAQKPGASIYIALQGAQIFWTTGKIAIVSSEEKLPVVQKSLIEVAYYEMELTRLERHLHTLWQQLEQDSPQAFEVNEQSVAKKEELFQHFQQILLLRARLARITPAILSPHIYPPTLASQINERIRERTRMPQRLEFLSDQLEVFERLYEMCSQRASEYVIARRGNNLEWIIIVLLLFQTLFSLYEIMTRLGQ